MLLPDSGPCWRPFSTRGCASNCKRSHSYRPEDLIQIFADVDVDSLSLLMKCENGDHGMLHVEAFSPSGREAVGLSIRRLVAIKSIEFRSGGRMFRLPEITYPLSVDTIGKTLACGHRVRLNLVLLARRVGMEYGSGDVYLRP